MLIQYYYSLRLNCILYQLIRFHGA
uniref:Uncharacterized protein n=1 Tax=Anguilla anguilla TaxID=7936 RepID=A0A0E9Q2G4_ANGAN